MQAHTQKAHFYNESFAGKVFSFTVLRNLVNLIFFSFFYLLDVLPVYPRGTRDITQDTGTTDTMDTTDTTDTMDTENHLLLSTLPRLRGFPQDPKQHKAQYFLGLEKSMPINT